MDNKEIKKNIINIKNIFSFLYGLIAILITIFGMYNVVINNDKKFISQSLFWGLIIGISFVFYFQYKEYQISIGGLFATCSILVTKWYYLPMLYLIAYLVYSISYTIKYKNNDFFKEEDIFFNISNLINVGFIINNILYYFTKYDIKSLDKYCAILIIACILECIISNIFISLSVDIESPVKVFTEMSSELILIYLMDIPVIITMAVMYQLYGFIGLSLSSSYIFVFQYAFTKQNESYTDALTGSRNKKFYEEMMPSEFQESCAIFFIDFNDFKGINDNYGHDVGDEILKLGEHILKESIKRDKDEVIRIGGDEFLLFIKDATRATCEGIIDRIKNLAEKRVYKNSNVEIKIRMSIGVALCPEEGNTKEELSKVGDSKMYEAKKAKDKYQISYKI